MKRVCVAFASTTLLVSSGCAANGSQPWMPSCLSSTCALGHPAVKGDYGPFAKGRIIVTVQGPPSHPTVTYAPTGGSHFVVYQAEQDDPVDYSVRSVFSYRPRGQTTNNIVVLYEATRAIPSMHEESASGGRVFGFNGQPIELEALTAKLEGVTDASKARTILAR